MKLSREIINKILDGFDFDLVHEHMVKTDWQWQNKGVPTIQEIQQTAFDLLSEFEVGWNEISTGGFCVRTDFDGNAILSFEVSSSNQWWDAD